MSSSRCHICVGTALIPRHICAGNEFIPMPHLRWDASRPWPHLRWDLPRDWTQSCSHVRLGWAGPCHICAGTERRRAPSANPRACAQDARRLVIAVRGTASVSDVSALSTQRARACALADPASAGVLARARVLRSVSRCVWAHPCPRLHRDWGSPLLASALGLGSPPPTSAMGPGAQVLTDCCLHSETFVPPRCIRGRIRTRTNASACTLACVRANLCACA
jgi:hypothetical protein